MYLVELRPGKEELYRTSDDLAAAIRRGDVDIHSRIYHRATSKWISITLHPQYKAITAQQQAQDAAGPEQAWTYLNAQSETLEGANPPGGEIGRITQLSAMAVERIAPQWRRLFALSVAGLALLLGMQLAFAGPRPPWAASGSPTVPASPAKADEAESARDEQVISLASTSTAWAEEETLPEETPVPAPAARTPAPVPAGPLPRAPSIGIKQLGAALPGQEDEKAAAKTSPETVEGLLARYAEAYDAALNRLGAGMRVARLNQLLASSRLTPDGGVTETRLGLAGAANFMRVFRQQQDHIEREYQDSFAIMSKERGWSTKELKVWHTRAKPRENPALARLSANLVVGVDSVLALLTAQAGAYQLGEGTIAFEDPDASRKYGQLRRKVSSIIDSARVAGGEEAEGPTNLLLQAIGSTRLPREL